LKKIKIPRKEKILLVKPVFKFIPLALMKLSTYHKGLGDIVEYTEGIRSKLKYYDKIYITSLFTWEYRKVIDAINTYKFRTDELIVGGHLTTFAPELIESLVKYSPNKITYHQGLYYEEVDRSKIDYSIFNLNYSIATATKGCIRKCGFCGVKYLEPNYIDYIPIKPQIDETRQHLQLWGNNDFASSKFDRIIEELISLGFHKGAKMNNRQRYVDFNQGTDCRLFNKEIAKLVSKVNIYPLRFSFDSMKEDVYFQNAIKLAAKFGIKTFSSYILYNWKDTPEEFYYRCREIVELSKELDLRISGFPMKYIPVNHLDRTYVCDKWTKHNLNMIRVITIATRGMLPMKLETFKVYFGKNEKEFVNLINSSEDYIRNRLKG